MSRWSASRVVTTATVGRSWWKERSYSSASTTYTRSPPRRRFPPQAGTRAPTKPVGSSPAAASTAVARVVVVVLPWVPAIPTTVPWLTMAPSASARLSTGMPRERAASTSGWSAATAAVITSAAASSTCAGSWPWCTVAPRASSSRVAGPGEASHPVTRTPARSAISARGDIPAPPIPMKCTGPRRASSRRSKSVLNVTPPCQGEKNARPSSVHQPHQVADDEVRRVRGPARARPGRDLRPPLRRRWPAPRSRSTGGRRPAPPPGPSPPPPRPASATALWNWWLAAAVGSGTRIIGTPQAQSSADDMAPARETAKSAEASASGISWMYGTACTHAGLPRSRSAASARSKWVGPVAQSSSSPGDGGEPPLHHAAQVRQQRLVHGARALAAAHHQPHDPAAQPEARPGGGAVDAEVRRGDRVAVLEHLGPAPGGSGGAPRGRPGGSAAPAPPPPGSRSPGRSSAPAPPRGCPAAARTPPPGRWRSRRSPPPGPGGTRGTARQPRQGARHGGHQPPVLPRARAADRLQREQRVRDALLGEHPRLHPPRAPTKKTSAAGSSRRSASPAPGRGRGVPPVPPPAKRTRGALIVSPPPCARRGRR
jgi:hypothetical protein